MAADQCVVIVSGISNGGAVREEEEAWWWWAGVTQVKLVVVGIEWWARVLPLLTHAEIEWIHMSVAECRVSRSGRPRGHPALRVTQPCVV